MVGKVFTNKFFSVEGIFEAVRKAWMVKGGLEDKVVGNNIFIFQFDQHILVLEKLDGNLSLREYKFNKTRAWMQAIDHPLTCMNMESVKQIGNIVGKFIEWDHGVNI